MPTNWKDPTMVMRVLAATMAASNLKLDYKAIARYMGEDFTYNSVEGFFRGVKKVAVEMQEEANGQGGSSRSDATTASKERTSGKADTAILNKVKTGRVQKSRAKPKTVVKQEIMTDDEGQEELEGKEFQSDGENN